ERKSVADENTITGSAGTELHRVARSRPSARMHIPLAASGLGLLLQGGVGVACLTGIPLERLLTEELDLDPELRAKLDVYLLDGKPVDDPQKALVRDGSRLGLAAGLPGIAGLAMRSGSALAGLRPDITHRAGEYKDEPIRPGQIELVLFSLALPLLAPLVLARGALVTVRQLLPYLRPALLDSCFINEQGMTLDESRKLLAAMGQHDVILLTASMETRSSR
ncbi:hypothetical protein LJB82_04210, partial [Desulfovibrio sp. OttesenSCG-928-M16]|nr:hypothetical protein [Desulfovibrio sp. OttesenSCG-928-M16]